MTCPRRNIHLIVRTDKEEEEPPQKNLNCCLSSAAFHWRCEPPGIPKISEETATAALVFKGDIRNVRGKEGAAWAAAGVGPGSNQSSGGCAALQGAEQLAIPGLCIGSSRLPFQTRQKDLIRLLCGLVFYHYLNSAVCMTISRL